MAEPQTPLLARVGSFPNKREMETIQDPQEILDEARMHASASVVMSPKTGRGVFRRPIPTRFHFDAGEDYSRL